jgi:hypothetical protein
MMRKNIEAKLLLNQKKCILKTKRSTTVEIDEIKENIRLKIWNDTEYQTKGMSVNKMDTNDKQHHTRDQESNNTDLGKIENNKHPGAEEQQHRVSNKLKEDLQLMWHNVRLL